MWGETPPSQMPPVPTADVINALYTDLVSLDLPRDLVFAVVVEATKKLMADGIVVKCLPSEQASG